jgi:hypothetical protein
LVDAQHAPGCEYLIDSVHVMALLVGLVAHLDPRAPQGPGTTTLKRTH